MSIIGVRRGPRGSSPTAKNRALFVNAGWRQVVADHYMFQAPEGARVRVSVMHCNYANLRTAVDLHLPGPHWGASILERDVHRFPEIECERCGEIVQVRLCNTWHGVFLDSDDVPERDIYFRDVVYPSDWEE